MLGTLAAGSSPVLAATMSTDRARLYDRSDATGLAALVRKEEITAMELLEEAIRRTELVNPKINAVTLRHYELARDYVKQNGIPDGPFAGVPFLLKDLGIRLAGTATTGGSRLLQGVVANEDSPLVRRHKRAGLVIFGKTNTPEFGMALTTEPDLSGPCRAVIHGIRLTAQPVPAAGLQQRWLPVLFPWHTLPTVAAPSEYRLLPVGYSVSNLPAH